MKKLGQTLKKFTQVTSFFFFFSYREMNLLKDPQSQEQTIYKKIPMFYVSLHGFLVYHFSST
jgi:hypothetical protein